MSKYRDYTVHSHWVNIGTIQYILTELIYRLHSTFSQMKFGNAAVLDHANKKVIFKKKLNSLIKLQSIDQV